MAIRTGQQYIDAMRKLKPEVWLNGERVENVVDHPYFATQVREIAKLYDMQHDPKYQDKITHICEETGELVGNSFLNPTKPEHLQMRRQVFEAWAESTYGLMGRTPDFVNTVITGMAANSWFYRKYGEQYGENIESYYKYVRDNDLFLTHAIVNPQNDRSQKSHAQQDEFTHLGVVRETEDGLIVRGAKMLATLAPITDEVIVYSYPSGYGPGDEKYAISFALPIDTPGIRMYCREQTQDGTRSTWDHPLASRFEEADALLVFDDVLVPWERVFINQNPEASNLTYTATGVNQQPSHQSAVRGLVKISFVAEVACAIADAIGVDKFLNVQNDLSEILRTVETIRALLRTAEREYEVTEHGEVRPNLVPLETIRLILPYEYPKAIKILQTIGAGGLLMSPTEADFMHPEIEKDMHKYYVGKEGITSERRVRLFKLAWDLCGEAFGQRLVQYERYYSGDPVRKMGMFYNMHKKANPNYLRVERALQEGLMLSQQSIKNKIVQ